MRMRDTETGTHPDHLHWQQYLVSAVLEIAVAIFLISIIKTVIGYNGPTFGIVSLKFPDFLQIPDTIEERSICNPLLN